MPSRNIYLGFHCRLKGGQLSLNGQGSQSRINMASANPGSFQPSRTAAFSASNPFSIQNILKPSPAEKTTHTRSQDSEDDTQLAALSCPFKPVHGQVIKPVAFYYRPRGLLSCTPMVWRHYGLAPHRMQPAIQMSHSPLIRNANPLGNGSFLPRDRHFSPRVSRQRPVFSPRQIHTLENEFLKCPYVTERKRAELASELSLTETQVKTWFQNRRTKWKRKKKEEYEAPLLERQKYCMDAYKHSWLTQTGFL